MPVIVQKYGGSSVADVDKLSKVAEKVAATRRAGVDVVVVVSAMGGTTDQLLGLAKQIDDSPPRRELDMLLSTGERVSMALLSMAIQKQGCDAISFTGSQSGIITNDRHFDARIIEVRPFRIEDELARGRVVIVAGYQGMSYKREITTLGRGGSDTTAIALAAALSADRAEIYSDVDGVYSADPRVVPDAKHLPELSYAAMQEMAEAGAKVLNATAVGVAKDNSVAIHARATFRPGKETIVREEAAKTGAAVVGKKGLCLLGLEAAALPRAIDLCGSLGLSVRDARSADDRAELLLDQAGAPDWEAAEPALRAALGGVGLSLRSGLGLSSVIAPRAPELASRCFAALSAAQLTPAQCQSSPLRLSFLMEESEIDAAVRALHGAV